MPTPVHACHACAFFLDEKEEERALLSFLGAAVRSGAKALEFVEPGQEPARLRQLTPRDAGDPASPRDDGVEVLSWKETYLQEGGFDPPHMLAFLQDVLQRAREAGFPRTRLWSDMQWTRGAPASDALIAYESQVNPVLAGHGDEVVCSYRLADHSATQVIRLLRAHPMVLVGEALKPNPFYTPTDQLLAELRKGLA